MSTTNEPWSWAQDGAQDFPERGELDTSDLPLEMYFAQGPSDRDRSFESAVLSKVGRRRGFVSRSGRRFVSTARYGIAGMALIALVAAAVADRLGVFWEAASPETRPVTSLVESAAETMDPLMNVSVVGDGLRESLRDGFPSGWADASAATERLDQPVPCPPSPARLVIGAQTVASVTPTRVHRAGIGWQVSGWSAGAGEALAPTRLGLPASAGVPAGMPGGVWSELLESGDANALGAAEALTHAVCASGTVR
ncbi:MAG: hypothetical protein AAGB48_06420 [Planctomycetota bacterium]